MADAKVRIPIKVIYGGSSWASMAWRIESHIRVRPVVSPAEETLQQSGYLWGPCSLVEARQCHKLVQFVGHTIIGPIA
jgi:hypothetical protein